MGLSQAEIDELAGVLYEAYDAKEPVEPLTEETELSTADAYDVQAAFLDRVGEDGRRRLGYKLGLVSEAKQEQLGIPEPIFCRVLPETRLEDGVIPTGAMIAPRVEAEIGLVLDRDLSPPVTSADVLGATRGVVPVVEVLESRYADWAIPTAQDVIADLTSAGGVVVGETLRAPSDVDLRMESVVIEQNGEVADAGVGADIMGHPARAVSWLANRLADRGEALEAGDLVMTGGITAAIDVEPDDVFRVEFGSIGSVTVRAE
jgi:2-keto-4-pentenoate hydratase